MTKANEGLWMFTCFENGVSFHYFCSGREKTYLLTCAPVEDSDQLAQSDPSHRYPHKETLHHWLSRMRPVTSFIRLRKCTG